MVLFNKESETWIYRLEETAPCSLVFLLRTW